MKQAVICFTRVPLAGRTKTRLLPVLTAEQCAALHTAFLQDISAVLAVVSADLFIAYDDPTGNEGAILYPIFPNSSFFPQQGAGLGERMDRALCHVLMLGYSPVVLIGSDLPLLTAGHINAAFDSLRGADVALGATPDGGYYLVGVNAPCPVLFNGQTYGSGSVLQNALAAAQSAGLSVALAPPCRDVDIPEDLYALRNTLRGAPTATAEFLRTLPPEKEELP